MTSGINVMVPTKDLIPVELSSEEALQYILTAGSIIPNRPPKMTIVADGKPVGQTEAETEPQTTEREIETGSKEKQAVSE